MTTTAGRQAALILLGPAAAGLCLGLRFGLQPALQEAALLPAVLIGVALLMTPALYIGAALTGIAPGARAVYSAMREGLASTSIVFLGLAPALAFLISTSDSGTTVLVLSAAVLALGVVLGLRVLYTGLFAGSESHRRALPLFAVWSLISMGIGGKLIFSSLLG